MKKIKLLITDDHTLIRESWIMMLNSDPRFEVVASCSSGEEAIELVKSTCPDVVTMDINLGGMTGIEATEKICKQSPGTKVLIVSLHNKTAYVKKLFQVGAAGYVTKNSPQEEMMKAIVEVYNNHRYICEEIKSILTEQALSGKEETISLDSLSEKELKIISYLKKGFSSKEIAKDINVTAKTVEVHRYNILHKLGLPNVAALINYVNNSQTATDL